MPSLDRRAILIGALPGIAAAAAVIAVQLTGTTYASLLALIDRPQLQFGYFAGQFPLITFVAVYAATHLLMVALTANRPHALFRPLLWVAGLAVLALAFFYPTVGGVLVRGGFVGFALPLMSAVPPATAQLIGGAMAGITLALILGLAHLVVDWNWRFGWGKLLRGLLALMTLAIMGVVIAQGWQSLTAFGARWPEASMGIIEALGIIVLLLIASLPHMWVSARSDLARRNMETPRPAEAPRPA